MHKTTLFHLSLWLLLAAMWSSSYVVIKIGVATLEPALLVFGRMLVGSLIIFSALKIHGLSLSRDPADWVCYAVTGLLGSALPFLLISYGEQSVDSALTSILMGTSPMVTLLLTAWLVPEEALTLRTALGVLGGLTGVAILVGPGALSGLGVQVTGQFAILAATASYATSTVYIRKYVKRPPLEMAAGSMIVGTVTIGIYAVAAGTDFSAIELTGSSLGAVVYLGVISTACANLIYFYLVPKIGANRMSQVNFAVPVGGAILSVVLLGEAMTPQRFIALLVIVGSVYLGTTKGRGKVAEQTGETV
ncbi:Permease of the drug/metabolite transporter (DMT) superfamily [Pseudovibrio denitrificans]|uniref:Permease of the drug/metabolite transporter (DMT) superfamily n=1 Tax=Pseudovibrio denitrificans TaxID=258256 RepID=A0A1I7DX75_9HYPH|nr:EamA family transporter [Pseudovibrio denitrificans]SFU16235.1 Permease of the drug/metabolite transporter (DMT) superfamily [Pseudovibrio denitrificans]